MYALFAREFERTHTHTHTAAAGTSCVIAGAFGTGGTSIQKHAGNKQGAGLIATVVGSLFSLSLVRCVLLLFTVRIWSVFSPVAVSCWLACCVFRC
jgi:hypothetical protein